MQTKHTTDAENKLNINVSLNTYDSMIGWMSRNGRETNSVEKYSVYL